MRRAKRRHDDFADALANFALTFAKAMLVLCVTMIVLLNPEAKKSDDGLKPKIEFLITAEWPEGNHDVDLWLQTPSGKIVFYGNREADAVALERDDLGTSSDTVTVNGRTVVNPLNEEAMAVRGVLPGEYIVNIHLYRSGGLTAGSVPPVPVRVRVQKFNPTLQTVHEATVALTEIRQEAHAVRFTVAADGTVRSTTTALPTLLRQKKGTP
jgi:hypothetical protein